MPHVVACLPGEPEPGQEVLPEDGGGGGIDTGIGRKADGVEIDRVDLLALHRGGVGRQQDRDAADGGFERGDERVDLLVRHRAGDQQVVAEIDHARNRRQGRGHRRRQLFDDAFLDLRLLLSRQELGVLGFHDEQFFLFEYGAEVRGRDFAFRLQQLHVEVGTDDACLVGNFAVQQVAASDPPGNGVFSGLLDIGNHAAGERGDEGRVVFLLQVEETETERTRIKRHGILLPGASPAMRGFRSYPSAPGRMAG